MPMYNLIERGDNYLKPSGSLREYYRDMPSEAEMLLKQVLSQLSPR